MRPKDIQDLYDTVTREIAEQLERGTRPYESGWLGGEEWPRNAKTLRWYVGTVNALILWSAAHNLGFITSRWVTAKQAIAMGGHVKDGERGTKIFAAGRYHRNADVRRAMRENRFQAGRGFQREYLLFNVCQCIGLPPLPVPPAPSPDHPIPRLETLVAATGADICIGGTRAFFDPGTEHIQLPPRELFFDPKRGYARTVVHELGHWAMHPSRLGTVKRGETGLQTYAWDEVVTELSTAMCLRRLGIGTSATSASYIGEWVKVLKEDATAIFKVTEQASRVADYLLSFDPGP